MKLPFIRRPAGFSLIELLVSVAVGLMALVFATRLFATSERDKQSAVGKADAMQSGAQALFSISKELASSGWGVNDTLVNGCNIPFFYDAKGYTLPNVKRGGADAYPITAVVIETNSKGSDTLTTMAGSAASGTGSLGLLLDVGAGSSSLGLDRRAFGFSKGDVFLIALDDNEEKTPARRCALGQVSDAPGPVASVETMKFTADSANRYNRPGGLGFVIPKNVVHIYNLGAADALAFHTWSVKDNFLQLRASNLVGAEKVAQPVIGNVILLKAQYGFDDDSATVIDGMHIKKWSSTMVDIDGDGVAGDEADFQRVAAVRVALVARSKVPDRPDANGKCETTTLADKPRLFATAEPSGVTAEPVDPELQVAGDKVDWTCYRYRVFETIVPLRNSAWRPSAEPEK